MPDRNTTPAIQDQDPHLVDFLVQVNGHEPDQWQSRRAIDASRAAAEAGVEALKQSGGAQPGATAIVYVADTTEGNRWPGTMNPRYVTKMHIEITEPILAVTEPSADAPVVPSR
jgi:hypothetical protein